MIEDGWRIGQASLNTNHTSAGHGPDSLGEVLWHMGDYSRAKAMLEEAIQIKKRVNGEDHPELISSLSKLGAVCMALGEYGPARQALDRARWIAEKTYGPDHPQVPRILNEQA